MDVVLQALSDESRTTVLEVLRGGPTTVGDLAARLPIARPGVSDTCECCVRPASSTCARRRSFGYTACVPSRSRRSTRGSVVTGPCGSTAWTPRTPRSHGGRESGGAGFTSGWEGPGRVDVCEPPRRLRVTMAPGSGEDETVIEAELVTDGDQTLLTVEERGFPLDELAAHGAGWQAHIEDLAAHLAGQERGDWRTRWAELAPSYRDRADDLP